MQPHEYFRHGPRQAGIHGEPVALPIDRRAETAHLIGDVAARLLLPLPHPLDERIASQCGAALARGNQLPLDHHLRGDARVIGAGLP